MVRAPTRYHAQGMSELCAGSRLYGHVMPDPTDDQREAYGRIREEYGHENVRGHQADAQSGLMHIELASLAGVWHWYLDAGGSVVECYLTPRLFTPETPAHKPANAIDN